VSNTGLESLKKCKKVGGRVPTAESRKPARGGGLAWFGEAKVKVRREKMREILIIVIMKSRRRRKGRRASKETDFKTAKLNRKCTF
jgi:hypothetical protein